MRKPVLQSVLVACSIAALPAATQAQELFEFATAADGNAWDAALNEPSNSGNYFLYQAGPDSGDSSNGYIMQPPGTPGNPLILFRDTNGDGLSNADPIDINAVLTVQDAGGNDQDFSVNSVDWRSVFADPALGRAQLTGMKDGAMVWEVIWGYNVLTTLTEAQVAVPDPYAGEITNLSGTIDSLVWTHPGYVDNVWNPSSLDNLDITIVGAPSGLEGDYNADGFVSQNDLDLVLLNWGDAVAPGGFNEDNIPGGGPFDGLMSQNELDGVLLNWGDGTPPALAAVPEPASLALLGLGLPMLARRKSRR